MTITRGTVVLPITGGLNEAVDPRLGISPIELKNCRYFKAGSLGKRYGSASVGRFNLRLNASVAPSSAPPEPDLLTTRGDELVRIGGGELDTVVSASTTTDSVYRGLVPEAVIRRTGQVGQGVAGGGVAIGTVNGRTVAAVAYCVQATSTTYRALFDLIDCATGALIISRYEVMATSGFTQPIPVVISNGYACVVFTSGAIKVKTLNLSTLTWSSDYDLASGSSISTAAAATAQTALLQDACAVGDVLYVAAYTSVDAGNRVSVFKVTISTLAETATVNIGGANVINSLAIEAATGEAIYLAYTDWASGTTTWRARAYALNLSSLAPVASWPVTLDTGVLSEQPYDVSGVERVSSTTRLFVWDVFGGGATPGTKWDKRNASAAAQLTGTTRRNADLRMAGKPFAVGSKVYIPARTSAATTAKYLSEPGTYVLVDSYAETNAATISTGRIVATAAVNQSAYCQGRALNTTGSKYVSLALTSPGALADAYSLPTTKAAELFEHDFGYEPGSACVANGTMVVPGGTPHLYDGARTCELGALKAPVLTYSTQSTSGSLTQLGTYTYLAQYTWRDASGLPHVGPLSAALTVPLTGSNDDVTLTATCLSITNRRANISDVSIDPVQIALYRTEANGDIFYLQGLYASTVNGSAVSIGDTTSDAAIAAGLPLNDSNLESVTPPSAGHAARILDRVWLTDTDDGSAWYSGHILAAEAPSFHPTRRIPPPDGSRYVASAGMDGNIVLYTEDALDVTFGDGPDDTGSGSFAERRRIATDIGCIDGRSIVVTPYGQMFQSRDGLARLDRSFAVSRFGKPVEDSSGATQSTPYEIRAAVNVPEQSEVRFVVGATSTQRAVVFDLVEAADPTNPDVISPAWYVYEWTCPIGGTPEIASACYWQGRFTWITTTGYVFQDDPSTYLDTSTGSTSAWVTMSGSTSSFNGQSLQSWMSVFAAGVLCERMTDHDLTIQVYQDWATSSPQSATWTRAEIDTARNSTSREQLVVQLATQKTQAVRVRWSDATPTGGTVGTGQGMRLTGITLELGPREGMVPLPAAARK